MQHRIFAMYPSTVPLVAASTFPQMLMGTSSIQKLCVSAVHILWSNACFNLQSKFCGTLLLPCPS